MGEGLQAILHDAYVKERKLVLLYGALMDGDDPETGEEDFLAVARNDQDGGIELLQEINRKYGNVEIEATIMDKLGENFLQLKSGHSDRAKMLRQVLDYESELVEDYKKSLPFLSNDDATRKLINRILTVKLVHKRDLLHKLNNP